MSAPAICSPSASWSVLFERERTGVGRWVHTSLLEAQVHMLDFQAARWLMDHEVAGQAGNDHPTGIPMGTFPTLDGYINIAGELGQALEIDVRGDRQTRMDGKAGMENRRRTQQGSRSASMPRSAR